MPAAHVRFSTRSSFESDDNHLSRLIAEARAGGRALIDLTETNPTCAGIFSSERLVAMLGDARGQHYQPLPFGHPSARQAVAQYYRERGEEVDPTRVIITSSTSEAYAYLFKLLADPGDSVLVPAPSYPLLAYLAQLESVTLAPYSLIQHDDWRVDLEGLRASVSEHTRAIVMIHPNNPTGSLFHRDDVLAIEDIAEAHGLALIADEVFGDYLWGEAPTDRVATMIGRRKALTFVLNGLSKTLALPQVKLSWAVMDGPVELVKGAAARLEIIADTQLSVSTPVQLALPGLLSERKDVQERVMHRVRSNLERLDAILKAAGPDNPVRRLVGHGGWSAVLELPRTRDEDAWLTTLVRDAGVLVHPGYFFDMASDGFVVVSLLCPTQTFSDGIERLIARVMQG